MADPLQNPWEHGLNLGLDDLVWFIGFPGPILNRLSYSTGTNVSPGRKQPMLEPLEWNKNIHVNRADSALTVKSGGK